MKKHWGIIILLSVAIGMQSCYDSIVNNDNSFNKKNIETYQNTLKTFYENPESTPLKGQEKDSFKGITFFPISEKYHVTSKVSLISNGDTISMPTSAKKIKKYIEYARLTFTLDGEEHALTAYVSDSPPLKGMKALDLFIPFKDETNGLTSYGAGRYLDIKSDEIKNNELILDFNKAYNPYCAYSIFYNCPIPPFNNHLKVEIPAGVSYED